MPKTIDNYKLPIPPIKTCEICGEEIKPLAHLEAYDGWELMGWDCEKYHGTLDDLAEHPWPFVEDYATIEDLEKLGFVTS
jgi:hypothetical protein